MINQHTPIKILSQSQVQNQYYNGNFTSGKKIKGVTKDVYSINRIIKSTTPRYTPFIQINTIQQPSITQPNLQQDQDKARIERQTIEVTNKCQTLKVKLQQLQAGRNQNDKHIKLLQRLQKARRISLSKKNQLIELKKKNLRQNRIVDLAKQKMQNQIQYIRQLIKKQQQNLYQSNKITFSKQKQKLEINNQIIYQQLTRQEINKQIYQQEKLLENLLYQNHQLNINLNTIKISLDQKNKIHNDLTLQLSVLKMQINMQMRVQFRALRTQASAKKKILEKNPNNWQKKDKILSKEDIKYYVIMQLYPSWRRLLNQLSYHFIGFKQLLFQQGAEQADFLRDLQEYIFTLGMKKTSNKSKSYIVVHSINYQSFTDIISSLLNLKGLNNGLINIENVYLTKTQENDEIVFDYTFKDDKRSKSFEIVNLKELSKQSLVPYLPRGIDKTAIIKIEIPFCFDNFSQKMKMQQIYHLFQRYK